MNHKHCCGPIWPATYQLPMPFLAQVAAKPGDKVDEDFHPGLAFYYAEDVLDLMIRSSMPHCPVRLDAEHVLEYALSDLENVSPMTRGVMVALLGRITEFALLHCSAASEWMELESAVEWLFSEGMVEPRHVPAVHRWIAETVWEASNSPRDEVAQRPLREASLDLLRVAFAGAWAAAMNLEEPEGTIPAYRAYEADATVRVRTARGLDTGELGAGGPI